MVNAAARAQNRIAMCPRDAETRVEIVVAGMKEGIGAWAVPAASAEIERNVVVAHGMQGVEKVVADSGRDRQIGSRFPFVLHIAEVLSLALPHQRQNRGIGGGAHVVVLESGRRGVGQGSALRGTLVEQNPSRLKPELEQMSALRPGQIVDEIESFSTDSRSWKIRSGS